MFEWVGDAVAMGQSPDRVKAAAHRVTATADDDGAAVVLESLLTGS
jgi:hydroxymethylpyrimidine pyrophosphatase-like HAD family hydrolase